MNNTPIDQRARMALRKLLSEDGVSPFNPVFTVEAHFGAPPEGLMKGMTSEERAQFERAIRDELQRIWNEVAERLVGSEALDDLVCSAVADLMIGRNAA